MSLCWVLGEGAVLYIVGRLAASLASTQDASNGLSPVMTKISLDPAIYGWGSGEAEMFPVKSHCSSTKVRATGNENWHFKNTRH